MARNQRVERGHRNADGPGPGLALPARRAVRRLQEGLGGGRHRRVVDIELEFNRSLAGADRDRLDRDRAIAAVEELERPDQGRLRLDRDHPGAEPAECGNAVADMRADVEHQIAALDEAAIEPVHGGAALAVAVIDPQRADDASDGPPRLAHGRLRERAAATATTVRARAARARAARRGAPSPRAGGRARPAPAHARPQAKPSPPPAGSKRAGRRR